MAEAVRTSTIVSVIRNLCNTYQLDKSDTNDSNKEEDEARSKQFSLNLSQTLRTRQLLLNFHNGLPVLTLRAPVNLVNFPTVPRPRWPIECEVISDIIQHIEWEPPEPEPFYQSSGHEETPIPVKGDQGKVVYCSNPAAKRPYFTCSRAWGSTGPAEISSSHVNHSAFTLEFESRFESGNLQKAVQVGVHDYELTLRADIYTTKHTQWFYFRVRNMKAGVTYRFTIINLMKSSSLYSHGMKPLLYSERAAKENGVGWQRTGSNIRYYRNCSQKTKEKDGDAVTLYSLTWTLQFPHDSDTCYLAHCYPYTYSDLQRYLKRISSNPAVALFCKVRVLCQSLAGNAVYVITITSREASRLENKHKKAVVVTARVHPGETSGSWVMEGFLDFLLGDSDDAQILRDNFVFKVVPMLNPDGVVVGNYRCSLAGRDLNRNYNTLLRDSFPCVWHTQNMVERLMAETEVVLYCDFHGHNRKNNVFIYGCDSRGESSLKLQERIFPLMMSKNASNKFSFKSCKFRVQKSKAGTGRIAMWRLGIRNSYTMEVTFAGSTLDDRRGTHFTTQDLKSLGFYFCDTLLDFCDPDQTKVAYCLTELETLLREKVRERIGKDLGTDCKISVSGLETSTNGSDSSDSDGLPVHLLNQLQSPEKTFKKKKKHLKTRKERNKVQPERIVKAMPLKVPQSSNKDTESDAPRENTDKESNKKKPVGQDREKWKLNRLIKKDGFSSPSSNSGEVSQVTPWQGSKPIKDDCRGNMSTSCSHQKTKCSHLSTNTGASPHSGKMTERRQCRCTSQLLHLSALLPLPQHVIHSTQHSVSYYQVCRGMTPSFASCCRPSPSAFASSLPAILPTERLLTPFTTSTKFSSRHIFRSKNYLQTLGNELSTTSYTSNSDLTKTKQQNKDHKDSSEGSFAHFL